MDLAVADLLHCAAAAGRRGVGVEHAELGGVLEAAGAVFDYLEAVAARAAGGGEVGGDVPAVGLGAVGGAVGDAEEWDAVCGGTFAEDDRDGGGGAGEFLELEERVSEGSGRWGVVDKTYVPGDGGIGACGYGVGGVWRGDGEDAWGGIVTGGLLGARVGGCEAKVGRDGQRGNGNAHSAGGTFSLLDILWNVNDSSMCATRW